VDVVDCPLLVDLLVLLVVWIGCCVLFVVVDYCCYCYRSGVPCVVVITLLLLLLLFPVIVVVGCVTLFCFV